jgi:hypothetical protein
VGFVGSHRLIIDWRSFVQDPPTAAELVEAVREFLEKDVFPALEGRAQFHTRVAMNVLAIVQRELEQSQRADAEEHARLIGMLSRDADSEASLLDLNAALAARIRDGSLDASREELVDHLRETLRYKLAIANPKYMSD